VQVPLAQAEPLEPHDFPSLAVTSAGQVPLPPVHFSAKSHVGSTAGRQTVPADAYWQVEVQHAEFDGSHKAPLTNLQASRISDCSGKEQRRGHTGSVATCGGRVRTGIALLACFDDPVYQC